MNLHLSRKPSAQRPNTPVSMPSGPPNPHHKPSSPKRYDRQLSWQVAISLFASFRYASQGIAYAFATQRNFRIHLVIGTLAIALSVVLQLEVVKVAVIALTIGVVLALELLNTAIESVVDLTVQQSYHELAKIAKDCAAGAVLVSAIASLIVAAALILPPLFEHVSALLG